MRIEKNDISYLNYLAREIRKSAVRAVYQAKGSHLGGALSMADLLAVLYGSILNVDPANPYAETRDRFILSKGHSCSALYSVLAERGFFPKGWLDDYCKDGAKLAGHVTHINVPGAEFSTGSLGHGLPIACGISLAAKRDNKGFRTFVMLGDGECDEGSVWEAALFASHHRLDNLIAIVDHNKIQSMGNVRDVLDLEPFADKWRAFGWSVREIDGHDLGAILKTFNDVPISSGKPSCVIAHTVKGKGVSFMEDRLVWHYKSPNKDEFEQAMLEIEHSNEKCIS